VRILAMLIVGCFLLLLSGCEAILDPQGESSNGRTVTLAEQLARLRNYARSGGSYVIEIGGNTTISPAEAALPTGLDNVTITLRGVGEMREIRLSTNGVLFTIDEGITLVLDENITLVGRGGTGSHVPPANSNNNHLVRINEGGTLIMNAGSRIMGNRNTTATAANGGGGVRVNNRGVLILDGGEISGNSTTSGSAPGDGGGVRVEFGGRFYMRNGTISGNSAGRDGGGVHVVYGGVFDILNGTISNNGARNGGGVSTAGAFRIGNGIIHGANAEEDFMNMSRTGTNASLSIAGTGTALVGTFNPTGEFSRLDALATINVTIHVVNGVLQVDHDGDGIIVVPGDTLADRFAWLRGFARSGGEYIIELSGTENISPTEAVLPTGLDDVMVTIRGTGGMREIRLSANGVLFAIGYGITLVLDSNITLIGRGGTGSHVPPANSNNNHLVRVNTGGTLIMNTGIRITGNRNTTATAANGGGGVRVNNGGVFIMYGGEISGNSTTSASVPGDGGGVRVEIGGRFDMRGGTIYGNNAGRDGGGVINGGTFTMLGGTIYDNDARNGGGVSNAGSFRMGNGIIYGTNTAEELRNTSRGGTSASLSNTDTALAGTFNPAGEFTLTDALATVNVTIHVVDGVFQVDHDGDGIVLVPGVTLVDQLAWLRGFARSGGEYRVEINSNENASPTEATLPTGLGDVTITLRGIGAMREIRLSANGVLFTVGYGMTLVLDENVALIGRMVGGHGGANNNNHLLRVNTGGTMITNVGSKIAGNRNTTATSANGGGGVRVNNGGVLIMYGGEISGNFTTNNGVAGDGGGLRIEIGGRFDMHSGMISGNSTGRDGGGVFNAGTVRISHGIIFGNNAGEGLQNTANRNGAALLNSGTVQRGTFSNGVFSSLGTLSTTNNTIEVP